MFCGCKKKQAQLPVQNAISVEITKTNHAWYYFTNTSFHVVDRPQNAPHQAQKPWTETIRISSANNAGTNNTDIKAYAIVNRLGVISFEDAKAEWYEEAGIDETNIHIFEALHEQYEALRRYAKNNADQEAIATIVRTFKEAGKINCLSYLASLKTVEEWAYTDDDGLFGSHLCAIMTGFDPGYPRYPNAERKLLLDTYNKEYWHYSEEVNRLVKESGIGER